MAHDVFISYASQDKAIADATTAALENGKVRCWVAPRDIRPGAPYANEIVEAIRRSRILVLVLSASANRSSHVMREVERAVHEGIPIIPLRIEEVSPDGSLEYFLGAIHWLDALTPPIEAHLQSLVDTVQLLLSREGGGHAASKFTHRGAVGTRSVGQSTARAPNLRSLVGAAVCLGLLPVVASFIFFVGPPWPDRSKATLITVLVALSTLAWFHSTWQPKTPRVRSRLFGSMAGILFVTFLVLTALFVYDAPTPSDQEAGGFIVRGPVAELLRQNSSMTIDDIVKGAEYDPNQVWEPWTVAAVRVALLSAWLGTFACAAIATAALNAPPETKTTTESAQKPTRSEPAPGARD